MDQKGGFESRFLSKLSIIDRTDIQNFLSHLVKEKNFLEIIFNALLDGVLVLRPSLEVMYLNNTAMEMLGITNRRRVVDVRITDLVSNEEFRELTTRFAVRRDHRVDATIPIGTPPTRMLRVTIIPLEADKDNANGSVVMMLHDATETEKLEEQRRRADRATAFTTLAAGLAHEIKNPLNSLQIHAQLLQRALREAKRPRGRMDTSRAEESSEIILEEIRRLDHVVNLFLDAVRPTRPMAEPTDINKLIDHVVATLRPEAEAANVELTFAPDHELPRMHVDSNQVTQAVINLVKNGLDAVEHAVNPRVEIRTGTGDDTWFIRVADNGVGIPADERGKIFEPYFTTKVKGTGLGLVIVSRIVEEHGGTLDLWTEAGKGTVVTLSFPALERPVRLLGGL
ncbi:hypothetical protein CVU37_05985 [candidate division BRC1 bacterium HGW-BRC1-1]|jgi:signal transduction histidine kinase|nr:MAG: hypothetical protein CVU37_05985 [candidate division BRC1 bacterium HGW-BRC1-1]